MIDIPYVECTCASLSALKVFQDNFPDHRTDEVSHNSYPLLQLDPRPNQLDSRPNQWLRSYTNFCAD